MDGTYGSNALKIKRALEYADMLRKQGQEPVAAGYLMPGGSGPLGPVPGRYIPESKWDMVGNVLKSAMGGYQANQAEQEQAALDAKAQREASEAVLGLPTMMKTIKEKTVTPGEAVPVEQAAPTQVPNSPFGTTEAGPVTPGTALPGAMAQFKPGEDVVTESERQVPKSIEEYAADQSRFAAGLDPTNPHLAPIREYALKKSMDMPEKVFEMREKAQAAKESLDAQLEAKKEQFQKEYELRIQNAQNQQELRAAQLDLQRQIAAANQQHQQATLQLQEQLGVGNLGIRQGMLELQRQGLDIKRDQAVQKTQEKIDKVQQGKENITSLLNDMEGHVDALNVGGGVPSSQQGALPNAKAWLSNTDVGQGAGKMFGTTNQDHRNSLEQIASYLVLELKNAKGLSASQMNSNMELQRYLTAVAGGKQFSAESLKENIRRSRELLGGQTGGASGSWDGKKDDPLNLLGK